MWQPIETAPMDGTQVDLWAGHLAGRIPNARWNAQAFRWEEWFQDGVGTMRWNAVVYTPTHWMPLPKPPND